MTPSKCEIDERQPLVAVSDLHTVFPIRRGPVGRVVGQRRAVDGVSFDVPCGTTLGVVGESGCGKTTLARTILGLIPAASGKVVIGGVDVLDASRAQMRRFRRDAQIIFQDPLASLNPRMTIRQIVAEPLMIHRPKLDSRDRVAELLTLVGLRASHVDSYPHELSGGQRQRVAIARALALEPKFVVCDEPVSALDVSIQSQILNLLVDLQRELGLTYLFIGHNLAVVRHVSDRIAVMYMGKIVELAGADDLHARPKHPYTKALLTSVPGNLPSNARSGVSQPCGAPPVPGSSPVGDNVAHADVRRFDVSMFRRLDVSASASPHVGCAYHPRCTLATDQCLQVTPQLDAITDTPTEHLAACHHSDMPPTIVP